MKILFIISLITFKNLYANEICKATSKVERVLFSPPVSMVVVGTGRLHFHSSTFKDCAIKDLFIVPNDSVIGYGTSSDDKWTEIMYVHPKTQKESIGWVMTSRLKIIGKIAPNR
jgi:hypothetical protein